MNDKNFGDKLKSLRLSRGWSKNKMAKYLGTTITTVSNLESGITKRPSKKVLQGISSLMLSAANQEVLYGISITNKGTHISQSHYADNSLYTRKAYEAYKGSCGWRLVEKSHDGVDIYVEISNAGNKQIVYNGNRFMNVDMYLGLAALLLKACMIPVPMTQIYVIYNNCFDEERIYFESFVEYIEDIKQEQKNRQTKSLSVTEFKILNHIRFQMHLTLFDSDTSAIISDYIV